MGPVGQPGPAVSTNFNSLKTKSDSLQCQLVVLVPDCMNLQFGALGVC